MSEQNVFKPPRSIKIDNYNYTSEDTLDKDYSTDANIDGIVEF